jgi:hypothetical protein
MVLYGRPVIIAVISILVATLIYGSSPRFTLLALPPDANYAASEDCEFFSLPGHENLGGGVTKCCWETHFGLDGEVSDNTLRLETHCQVCVPTTAGEFSCGVVWEESGLPTLDENVLPPPPLRALPGGDIPMAEEADPTPTTPTPPPGPRSGLGSILPGEGFVQEPSESTPPPQTGEIAPQEVPPAVPGAEPPTEEEADQGTTAAPRTVQPLTKTCPFGNVWNPDWMICVPDVPPLELCPDGSLPQPTGPGGTQPECPSSDTQAFQAEEPEQTPEEEEPEEPEAEGAQQPTEEDGSEESSNSN